MAIDLSLGIASRKFEEMRDFLDKLTDINLSIAKAAHDQATVTSRTTTIMLSSVTGLGILAGTVLLWVIVRGILSFLSKRTP